MCSAGSSMSTTAPPDTGAPNSRHRYTVQVLSERPQPHPEHRDGLRPLPRLAIAFPGLPPVGSASNLHPERDGWLYPRQALVAFDQRSAKLNACTLQDSTITTPFLILGLLPADVEKCGSRLRRPHGHRFHRTARRRPRTAGSARCLRVLISRRLRRPAGLALQGLDAPSQESQREPGRQKALTGRGLSGLRSSV
jgi:hypothetical protein